MHNNNQRTKETRISILGFLLQLSIWKPTVVYRAYCAVVLGKPCPNYIHFLGISLYTLILQPDKRGQWVMQTVMLIKWFQRSVFEPSSNMDAGIVT